MQVLVARVGKAHGLRGEVALRLHTDVPGERFRPGCELSCDPPIHPVLTVSSARVHRGIWLVGFAEVGDRSAAEDLRGASLFADIAEQSDEADAWYEDDLVGLRVDDPTGTAIGTVTALHTRPAQDLLGVRLDDGREGLVPFVTALVPVVDVPGGRIVLDAPSGLFDLEPGGAGSE